VSEPEPEIYQTATLEAQNGDVQWDEKFEMLVEKLFFLFISFIFLFLCLQCFDAVGWAAGKASGL